MCDGTGYKDHAGFSMDECDCGSRNEEKVGISPEWRDHKMKVSDEQDHCSVESELE